MTAQSIKCIRRASHTTQPQNGINIKAMVPATAVRVRVEKLGKTVVVWHSSKLPALLTTQAT